MTRMMMMMRMGGREEDNDGEDDDDVVAGGRVGGGGVDVAQATGVNHAVGPTWIPHCQSSQSKTKKRLSLKREQ